jgi:ribosomal protein L10
MPSRKEIIASILGSLQSPMVGILGVLQAIPQDLVSVLDAIEKKKQAA